MTIILFLYFCYKPHFHLFVLDGNIKQTSVLYSSLSHTIHLISRKNCQWQGECLDISVTLFLHGYHCTQLGKRQACLARQINIKIKTKNKKLMHCFKNRYVLTLDLVNISKFFKGQMLKMCVRCFETRSLVPKTQDAFEKITLLM